MPKKLIFIVLVAVSMLTACASHIPIEIRGNQSRTTIHDVQTDIKSYKGQYIRWGGTIINVENNASDTLIEVVSKELNSYGQPKYSDHSLGRFLIRIDRFIDPAIYKEDRELTVYGVVEDVVDRQLDNFLYSYPLVKAEKHYLWRYYADYHYRRYSRWYYPPYGYHYPYHYGFHFGHHYGYHFGYQRHYGYW